MAGCLTRNEGLLAIFSFLAVYVIAFYAVWKISLMLFPLFILVNTTAWAPYGWKICPRCENICPFNPDKRVWRD